jgi:general secretion pathway protein D
VGIILKITPQINEGDAVMLKIDQEASSLAQGSQGAVDLITNSRKITTKVLVEDGGLIVLGGLTQDDLTEGENRVPWLGSIPILGNLFKARNVSKKKTNLMVFLHPVILRDGVQTAVETNARYNAIRDEQRTYKKGKVTLLPGDTQPALAPLEQKTRYVDPQDAADTTPVIDARQPNPEEPPVVTVAPLPPATEPPTPPTRSNGPAVQ